MPDMKKKPRLRKICSLIEPWISFSYDFSSFSVLYYPYIYVSLRIRSYGDLRKGQAAASPKQATVSSRNTSCLKIPTNIGPTKPPIPQNPCAYDNHLPTSSTGAAKMRQILVCMINPQQNRLNPANMKHWVSLVCMKDMTIAKIPIPMTQTRQITCPLGSSQCFSRVLYRIAARMLVKESSVKTMEQSRSSIPRSAARKGMSPPTLLRMIEIRKKFNMQIARQQCSFDIFAMYYRAIQSYSCIYTNDNRESPPENDHMVESTSTMCPSANTTTYSTSSCSTIRATCGSAMSPQLRWECHSTFSRTTHASSLYGAASIQGYSVLSLSCRMSWQQDCVFIHKIPQLIPYFICSYGMCLKFLLIKIINVIQHPSKHPFQVLSVSFQVLHMRMPQEITHFTGDYHFSIGDEAQIEKFDVHSEAELKRGLFYREIIYEFVLTETCISQPLFRNDFTAIIQRMQFMDHVDSLQILIVFYRLQAWWSLFGKNEEVGLDGLLEPWCFAGEKCLATCVQDNRRVMVVQFSEM